MMDIGWFMGHGIGWLGVAFGFMVAPPQLWRIILHKRTKNISRTTYGFLLATMSCYLLHAIYIKDWPFIVSNGINLSVNGFIFVLLLQDGKKYKKLKIKPVEETSPKKGCRIPPEALKGVRGGYLDRKDRFYDPEDRLNT